MAKDLEQGQKGDSYLYKDFLANKKILLNHSSESKVDING